MAPQLVMPVCEINLVNRDMSTSTYKSYFQAIFNTISGKKTHISTLYPHKMC